MTNDELIELSAKMGINDDYEPDKLIKKWQTLLNSSNDSTAMLIEPMEMEIKMDRE
jgi:hypothetical protein